MNLKQWAERQGVSYVTARRWFAAGRLPVQARRVGGLILVGDTEHATQADAGTAVDYARVSSADQKADLDRQVARVTTWATGQGNTVGRVVTETGSALNGHRREFLALLRDPSVSAIVGPSTGTGSPGSALSTPGRRSPRPGAGCSWWTRPRSMMTWSGT